MTLFAFDAGEGVSTHAAPGDAMAYILEGEAQITIDGVIHQVTGGGAIIMPAGIPHAVKAITPFKMLLTVVEVFRHSRNNLNGTLGKASEMYLISDSERPLRGIYPNEIDTLYIYI